ncbi:hypothetical protein C2S53_001375 [Perilla frutescens var. hirtella]|uniref:Uncharacterized protein n=1 Tax=Perilla frutescens var. hirtella TaxID=608512 RepID=A0AAD4P3W9_PERFH|nr:hypothetical protein C2S53_001375 [Perilla frutescens var. hirtella]
MNSLTSGSLISNHDLETESTSSFQGTPLQRFDTLKYLAPYKYTEEVLAVLHELNDVLVQGLWVAKTALVYKADNGINASDKDQAIRVTVRDRVLLSFSKNMIISNFELPPQPQRANAMKVVLHGLARERPFFNDLKLKELPYLSFIKLNPAIVECRRA